MIKEAFMAWSGFYGGEVGNLLSKWEEMGVFSYVLPFLIIFALTFSVLGRINVFKDNKAISSIISLAVGLMALQFEFVPRFFAEIFPRVGIGLAIILVILILLGLFLDPDKNWINIVLFIVGAIIVVVVLINTAGSLGWQTGYWWEENWGTVLGIVIFLVIIGMIIRSGGGSEGPKAAVIPMKGLAFK